MKLSLVRRSIAASVVLAALAAPSARAVVINYSLSSFSGNVAMSNDTNATVSITSDTFSVDLTPNVPLEWSFLGGSVTLPSQATASGSGTIAPTLTITSPSATPSSGELTQNISIAVTAGSPATTDVIISQGAPITYDLGGQYTLSVTPSATSRIGQEGFTIPFSNSAEFLLTPIPEPGSLALLACGGLLLARRRARG